MVSLFLSFILLPLPSCLVFIFLFLDLLNLYFFIFVRLVFVLLFFLYFKFSLFFSVLFFFLFLTESCVGNHPFSPPPLSGLGTSKMSLTSRFIQAELSVFFSAFRLP